MFGSKSSTSNSSSQSGANINSSGWVVGKGSASGGNLQATNSNGFKLPTAALISLSVIGLAFVYFKNKKAK